MIELMRALHPSLPHWQALGGRNANQLLADERDASWYKAHVLEDMPITGRRSPLVTLRNELELRRHAGSSLTLVHRTYHPILDLLPRTVSVVETLHDLWDFVALDERNPRAAARRHLKRRALMRADRIICVSQSTCNYLGDLWPHLLRRATVIPHGTGRISASPVRIDRQRPYFLFVGRRDRYKNFSILLDAIARIDGDSELVCFGGGPFMADEQHAIARHGVTARVHQIGGDDSLLAGYYEDARALLYPSRHEGFGLPLLEAMSHGCPVVAAPLTSLPEVGGDAAFYADADEVDAWADIMRSLLEDEALRANAIAAGLSHSARFSWQETARRHIALYDEMKGQ